MGHHFSIPYSGGGLIVINVQAHLAWALAEKCGYRIDEKAWPVHFPEVKKSKIPRREHWAILQVLVGVRMFLLELEEWQPH